MLQVLRPLFASATGRRRVTHSGSNGARDCCFERLELRTLLSASSSAILSVVGNTAVPLGSVSAPFEAFLKIDGITGDSQDASHPGWISVLGFSESVTHPGFPITGGRFSGRSTSSDFEIIKSTDSTFPTLSVDCANGKHFGSAVLEVIEANKAVIDYKLSNATIGRVLDEGDGSVSLPTEQVSFTFQKLEWDYTPVNADGSLGQTVVTTWDFSANRFPQLSPSPLSSAASQPSANGTPFMAFLKLDGVDGSSQDAAHKDWIDVLSFSEGLSRGSSSAGGGGGAGKVSFSDLNVLTRVDKTTPTLFLDAARNKVIASADLEVAAPDGTFLDYKLSDVVISSVSDKGSTSDSTPLEQISLSFRTIEWDYTPASTVASNGTPVSASWKLSSLPSPSPVDLPAVQSPANSAAFVAFLKLDGVDGSSHDADHKDWIDVLSFSEGLSRTLSAFGGGGGAGKVSISDLSVLTRVDKTTPTLFLDAASGKVIKSAELDVLEPDGAVLDYKLSDVIVSSVKDKGSAGDSAPLEQVSLSFSKIVWEDTPVNADGQPGDTVSTSWNLSSRPYLSPAVGLAAPQPSANAASFMAFLKLDGVDGSSQNADHKDWIDVLSFSEGLSKTSSAFGGGGGAGKVSVADLSVLTRVDKTTPTLFFDAASGKVIKTAELDVVKPDGTFLEYKLSDVIISSVSDKGSAGDATPLEQVSLSFSKIEWDYTPLNADGKPGDTVSTSWDLSSRPYLSPVALAPPQPSGAAFMALLKLDGVDGSSQDSNHKDWIDVLSFSESLSKTSSSGGGGGAGKVSISDLSVLTPVDKSTPTLFLDAISGKVIKSAELDVVEPDGAVLDYKLSDVFISSLSHKGSAGDSTPLEQINLSFSKIVWEDTPVNADGSPGDTVSAGWNLTSRPHLSPVALAAPQPVGTGAAFMAFLKLDGVDGSSRDSNHKDWIDVLSFSEGLSKRSAGGGGGAGKVSYSDLTVLTHVDKTTPTLFLDAASGKVIKSAELEVVEPDGTLLDYKLSNVIISSVSDKGSTSDSTPLEQIRLSFSKIEWDYTPANPNGSGGTPTSANSIAGSPSAAWQSAAAASGWTANSAGHGAVDALFGDPALSWLAYYRPSS